MGSIPWECLVSVPFNPGHRQASGSGLNSQAFRPLVGLWDQRTPQREGLGDSFKNHGSSGMAQILYHKAELRNFGSLGWSLILAVLPMLVRQWREPSLEQESQREVYLTGGETGIDRWPGAT